MSPDIKQNHAKRMNRNEFISLKTRAHSYGGGGSGITNNHYNNLNRNDNQTLPSAIIKS